MENVALTIGIIFCFLFVLLIGAVIGSGVSQSNMAKFCEEFGGLYVDSKCLKVEEITWKSKQ